MTAADQFELALRGTPPKFVQAARAVWRAVPGFVRADLRRRSRDTWPPQPCVFIVDNPVDGRAPALSIYQQESGAFIFNRAAVEKLSDEALRALIAHELVHAWQFDTVRSATQADEDQAEATAAAWGFPWKAEYDARSSRSRVDRSHCPLTSRVCASAIDRSRAVGERAAPARHLTNRTRRSRTRPARRHPARTHTYPARFARRSRRGPTPRPIPSGPGSSFGRSP